MNEGGRGSGKKGRKKIREIVRRSAVRVDLQNQNDVTIFCKMTVDL